MSESDHDLLVSSQRPGRRQERLAAWVTAGLVISVIATAPFADLPLSNTEALLPAYAAAVLINDVLTATLLLALYAITRSRAILVLSLGYLFTGLMVVPWALTFPGVFAPFGLFDAGLQSTAWIAAVRRLGFPAFVLAYALLKSSDPAVGEDHGPAARTIAACVATAFAASGILTWLFVTDGGTLPRFMIDATHAADVWSYIPAGALLICIAALGVLLNRPRSTLDLWLMIVLFTVIIEVLLLAVLSSSRFSLGWWAGRLYGLASASFVLIVLLSETTMLYARLARAVAAERRSREDRLTTMEALSASIAHEVNQPLSSMVTNAEAGLRFLQRERPDLDETAEALRSIAADGHRAGKTVEGIRTMFRKDAQERVPVDLNALISAVVRRTREEGRLTGVTVQADLAANLPEVVANPLQVRQVLLNLIDNAIEAMAAVDGGNRTLRLGTGVDGSGDVEVSVCDSGSGLDPENREHIFDPFFTTKSHGMGMGLMICRSIVEAHGGRLRMSGDGDEGATFQFTLPAAADSIEGLPK